MDQRHVAGGCIVMLALMALASHHTSPKNEAGHGNNLHASIKEPQTPPTLDPNQATATELMFLPGIGPKLAERIVAYRASHRFSAPDDLLAVKGIGKKKLATLRPYLTLSEKPSPVRTNRQ